MPAITLLLYAKRAPTDADPKPAEGSPGSAFVVGQITIG
jgi:hypothetical protein